jgi:hypothetical protein
MLLQGFYVWCHSIGLYRPLRQFRKEIWDVAERQNWQITRGEYAGFDGAYEWLTQKRSAGTYSQTRAPSISA